MRTGRHHSEKTTAALAMRYHDTPSTETLEKSNTAKAGPR